MKKINILIIIIFILMFAGIFVLGNKKTDSDAVKFKKEYEVLNGQENDYGKEFRNLNISENNPIVYKTANDIVSMIDNKETFAVYFGFSKCPWCRSVLPTMFEVANDLGIDKIYYVDVSDIRDTKEYKDGKVEDVKAGSPGYNLLLILLKDVLDDYNLTDSEGNPVDVDEKRIYAPNIITVLGGKPEGMTTGISDSQTDPNMEITDDMKKEMYEKIKCTLECISKESTVCEKKAC